MVDAPYAIPNEDLPIKDVRERLYRGFERTMDELQEAINIFKEKKSRIMFIISSFSLLSERTKKYMIAYVEDFYRTLNNKRSVRSVFIANARRS